MGETSARVSTARPGQLAVVEDVVVPPWGRRRSPPARTDERDDLAAIDKEKAGHDVAIERADGHRGVGKNGFADSLEHEAYAGAQPWPRPVERRDKRVAEDRGQRVFQSSSTVATRRPTTALATPRRAASFVITRETKDGGAEDGVLDIGEPPRKKARMPSFSLFPMPPRNCPCGAQSGSRSRQDSSSSALGRAAALTSRGQGVRPARGRRTRCNRALGAPPHSVRDSLV